MNPLQRFTGPGLPALVCFLYAAACVQGTSSLSGTGLTLEPYRIELLDLAFAAASAIPHHPHLKDRSRAQAAVVEAALKLNQPQKALSYIEQIDNWRRGAGYADLALYYARHQQPEPAGRYLRLAERIAENGLPSSPQDTFSFQEWRQDHIRIKMANVYAAL